MEEPQEGDPKLWLMAEIVDGTNTPAMTDRPQRSSPSSRYGMTAGDYGAFQP